MNPIVKYFIYTSVLFSLSACSKEDIISDNGKSMHVCFDAELEQDASMRTVIAKEGVYNAYWKRGDRVGVIASYDDGHSLTESRFRHFSSITESRAKKYFRSASFAGELADRGEQEYTFHMVYPYPATTQVSDIHSVALYLDEIQYPDIDSWDGQNDILVSKPVSCDYSVTSTYNLSNIRFCRLFGCLKIVFEPSLTESYGEEIVESISLSDLGGGALAGEFSVDLMPDEAPSAIMKQGEGQKSGTVTLDYHGKNAKLSDVQAYFILNPGEYENVRMEIVTANHCFSFERKNLEISQGDITSAALNLKGQDNVSDRQSLFPRNPSSLNILVFGHSFVIDSVNYLDDLMNAAGYDNVTLYNFHIGNASVTNYYSHWLDVNNTKGGTDKINCKERYYYNGSIIETEEDLTIVDAIESHPWDIMIFQTSINQLGYYDIFIEDFLNLRDSVIPYSEYVHGKKPLVGWHMFWAFASHYWQLTDFYSSDQELNYFSHVKAAKKLLRNGEIDFIIPTGTAIQTLRSSSLNTPYEPGIQYEFTRDGHHLDFGIGQYAAACTWYEALFKPIFNDSVVGNTFYPASSKVNVNNMGIIQKVASLAVQYPFEITYIGKLEPMDVSGDTESFNVDGPYSVMDTKSDIAW